MPNERFRPELPIHKISESNFDDFKKKYLDKGILEKEDLESITKLFGLDDRSVNNPTGAIDCDEAHQHDYSCNKYYSPEAGIVDRLLIEINEYRTRLKEIRCLSQ